MLRRRDSRRLKIRADLPNGVPGLSDDDLLLLAIGYVKEVRGDSPDFLAEVAAVFEMLKGSSGS